MISAKIITTLDGEKPDETIIKENILADEIKGIHIVHYLIRGKTDITENCQPGFYDVLLSLSGKASLVIREKQFNFNGLTISRIPYKESYKIRIEKGDNCSFIRLRKILNKDDRRLIGQNKENHSFIYIRNINDCLIYTEHIKSDKTLNKMLLPVDLVPRFCMGTVETQGPDEVGEHEHAILDQLFLWLNGCRCTCHADGEQILLTENMMLHIPLGSKHSVTVEPDDTLYYMWFDFFLTLEGQKYMGEQHQMDDI